MLSHSDSLWKWSVHFFLDIFNSFLLVRAIRLRLILKVKYIFFRYFQLILASTSCQTQTYSESEVQFFLDFQLILASTCYQTPSECEVLFLDIFNSFLLVCVVTLRLIVKMKYIFLLDIFNSFLLVRAVRLRLILEVKYYSFYRYFQLILASMCCNTQTHCEGEVHFFLDIFNSFLLAHTVRLRLILKVKY